RARARRAAGAREALAGDAPLARYRDLRRHGGLRFGDRAVVLRPRGIPRGADPHVLEGPQPRLRREPAPAGGVLRRGGRAAAPALTRRAAARQGALLQHPDTTTRPRQT